VPIQLRIRLPVCFGIVLCLCEQGRQRRRVGEDAFPSPHAHPRSPSHIAGDPQSTRLRIGSQIAP
jgi:hypothetical protein